MANAKKGAAKVQRKVKSVHRARKPRPVRPLDVAKPDNHEARHEVKKERKAAHEALLAAQAAEKADRLDAEQRAREIEDQRLAALAVEEAGPALTPAQEETLAQVDDSAVLSTPTVPAEGSFGMDAAADFAVDTAREDRVFGR